MIMPLPRTYVRALDQLTYPRALFPLAIFLRSTVTYSFYPCSMGSHFLMYLCFLSSFNILCSARFSSLYYTTPDNLPYFENSIISENNDWAYKAAGRRLLKISILFCVVVFPHVSRHIISLMQPLSSALRLLTFNQYSNHLVVILTTSYLPPTV